MWVVWRYALPKYNILLPISCNGILRNIKEAPTKSLIFIGNKVLTNLCYHNSFFFNCIMEKKVFCNLVFELQWPLAINYNFTLWMLLDKSHELQKLQFIAFLRCECYWTSHMSCKNCISPYIWCNWMQIHCNSIKNNSFSTTMQLHYNYNHNVMLMLLIFIHVLKFDTWHYEDFWILKLLLKKSIDLHHLLWLLMMVRDYDMWQNKKIATWHVNWNLSKNKNKNLF